MISQELTERYLILFPHTLLLLSASPRMSGFIYQVSYTHIMEVYTGTSQKNEKKS